MPPRTALTADDACDIPYARKIVGMYKPASVYVFNYPVPLQNMDLHSGRFQRDLSARLSRGEHIVLYGPRGSGKSILVSRLYNHFLQSGIPCGVSARATHLDDITQALERAYPEVNTTAVTRRQARGRLRAAADANEGVLLLDHVTTVGTVAVGLLRRLRGGIAGVLLVFDVEVERERERLRARHLGHCLLRMPAVPAPKMRRLLRSLVADGGLKPLAQSEERQLLRGARGRPGWVVRCVELLRTETYRRDGALHAAVLCADTEISLRGEGLGFSGGRFDPPTQDAIDPS